MPPVFCNEIVASFEGDNSVVFYYLSVFKSGLIKGVAFLEGDNIIVLYYLSTSEIWPDWRGDLWWRYPYKRGVACDGSGMIRGVDMWWKWPYKRGGL